jgi:hypothetical protein
MSRWEKWELGVMVIAAWVAFITIPLALGEIGLSWDALNHHIYLGWTAQSPRFDRDMFAAAGQTTQFPYLYWPVYKLYALDLPGKWAGAVLATLNVAAVPAVWLVARACVPGDRLYEAFMRLLAVVLAFITAVMLSLFDSTSNDLLAAIPLAWAIAFGLRSDRRGIVLSGLCAGTAVAFKLSNGPLAIVLPLLWLMGAGSPRQKILYVVAGSGAVIVAFVLVYGFWGWQLWSHFGNPIYPFYDHWFAVLRSALGWQP